MHRCFSEINAGNGLSSLTAVFFDKKKQKALGNKLRRRKVTNNRFINNQYHYP